MTKQLTLVTPPAVEPVSLADAKLQLRVTWSSEDAFITDKIVVARNAVETYTRRALIKQEWLLEMDSFPGTHPLYVRRGFPAIYVPKPPFNRVVSFQYVDTAGALQPLQEQTDYGRDSSFLWGYQLMPGSDTGPARLTPPWARPWPPTRRVAGCVQLDFLCGYCDAAYVSIAAGALGFISGAIFDPAEDGSMIYIPGAGPLGTRLVSKLAVDGNGHGRLTPAATTPVTNALAFVGGEVPAEILQAIKLHCAWQYARRGDDAAEKNSTEYPDGFENLLNAYVNRVA